MKKYFAVIIATTVTITSAGCSSTTQGDTATNDSDNDATTITFSEYSMDGDNQPYADQMAQAYMEANPGINIDVRSYGFEDYFSTLQTQIAGNMAPDVYEVNLENFYAFASKGAAEPLDDYMTNSNFDTSKYNENIINAFNYNGKQYALPDNFSTLLLIYNKDLFDQAGIAYPNSDWTWDDMDKAGTAIRALGDDTYGLLRDLSFQYFCAYVVQNGGAIIQNGEYTVNSPENVQTLQYLVDEVLDSNISPTDEQMGGMDSWSLFESGNLGMIVDGTWSFADFARSCNFNWDIAVLPGNTQKATNFFSDCMVMSPDSKNKEQAFDFMNFMSTSDEVADIRINNNLDLPAIDTPDVRTKYCAVTPPNNRAAVYDSLDFVVAPPQLINYNEVHDMANNYIGEAKAGQISPQEALDSIQNELEANFPLN